MDDSRDDAMAQCEALAAPMGEFIGGAASVPAFAGGMIATSETGPGALLGGAAAGYGAYEGVSHWVQDHWSPVVCDTINNLTDPNAPDPLAPLPFYLPPPPEMPAASPDLVDAQPHSSLSGWFGGGSSDSSTSDVATYSTPAYSGADGGGHTDIFVSDSGPSIDSGSSGHDASSFE